MKNLIYWASTLLVSVFMLFAAYAYLTHQPKMMASFAALGYPSYFPSMLAVFKILGAITLLAPRFPLLKEWAYAGFTFTFIGAFVSHLAMGQTHEAAMPVITALVLAVSYFSRPLSRRVPPSLTMVSETAVVEAKPNTNV